ncbi:sarcosine oxidase subunit gamma [Salipiger sp. CCB-MM3]|uniref:sarcosine oxidase subunit gamma n=1 Tax=Salipiger sp. CCB-MM3 TaxID=1792508 RepID=UPI00080AA3DD|nr:sarcosine oxidase subunit gamma family protein [Salipiger sp. CCB-MM3]ANT62548.1 sarcosine oxidase subunit gamma [Salipiger sp. CCB-MM3]
MNAPLSAFPPATQVETSAAKVSSVLPKVRFSLRARGDLAPLEQALGVALPRKIGETVKGAVEVACLGPDEWLLLAAEAAPVTEACTGVYATLPHSLVEISAREVTFVIEGPRAAELMTIGCARDIDGITVGSARRTLFDGATVTLWRDADDRFRMDVWNSFAPHLLHLLQVGVRELAAETL